MANTQTTVPAFVASQVLTAEEMTQSASTGVPVFATTVTRDAGFGGSGQKALAQGQLCYLEATDVVQYYDGSAWATLAPAAPAAAAGLTFISSGSVGTGTSFSLPNDSFTATYKNYSLFLNSVRFNGGTNLMARMRASGTDTTSADYIFMLGSINSDGTYAGIGGGAGATAWRIGSSNNTELGVTSGQMFILTPQTTAFTRFTTLNDTGGLAMVGSGTLQTNTQYDSITFYSSNGTSIFNDGTYTLYGQADS